MTCAPVTNTAGEMIAVASGGDSIIRGDVNGDALDAFESRKAELKDDGKAGRWFSPLELHVLPKLGKVPVADIDQIGIRDTLNPIWHTRADTRPGKPSFASASLSSTLGIFPSHKT